MAVHLIVNRCSGSYCAGRVDQIMAQFGEHGVTVELHQPDSVAAAESLVAGLCAPTMPILVAIGGDGTIATVLNALLPGQAVLGIIPMGTANVLAREIGVRSVSDAVNRIIDGRRRLIQVGRAKTSVGTRLFLLMAGIGFDGTVVQSVRLDEKERFGPLAYLLAGLRALQSGLKAILTVTFNGTSITAHSVVITNSRHYGGPFTITPDSGLYGGGLAVVPFSGTGRVRFMLQMLRQIVLPKRFGPRCTEPVHVDGICAVQLDGDAFGMSPAVIDAIPSYIELLC